MLNGSSFSYSGYQLLDACRSGDIAAARKLLDDGVDVNWKDKLGWTGLICASVRGRIEVMKLLLDRGAQIDIQSDFGYTALMLASYHGKVDCARLLLEKGADMSFKDKNKKGMTAKNWAKKNGHADIVQLLNERETKTNSTPQTQAVTEVALPQAQVLGELVLEPINKALQEENRRLKTEIEVLKERESSKNKEMLLKQELVDEYKARAKSVEEENQRAKDEIHRARDEIQRLRDEVSSLKERAMALRVENEYMKRREEELRAERNTERTERIAEQAMFQTMISSLMNGLEDRKRKRNDEETK